MSNGKLIKFKEIQKVINNLNRLLDDELKSLEIGQHASDEKIQEITKLIDSGISKQLEILGYVKK